MTFNQQVVATCIGAFAGAFFGFVASLIVFWIKEAAQKSSYEKVLIQNLRYELDYNINLYQKYITEITGAIEAVGADNKSIFLNLNYSSIARFFAVQFYQAGLLKKFFHCEDMKRWNDFLLNLREGGETYIMNRMEKWRAGTIRKDEAHAALNLERKHIQYALDMTNYIKQKIA